MPHQCGHLDRHSLHCAKKSALPRVKRLVNFPAGTLPGPSEANTCVPVMTLLPLQMEWRIREEKALWRESRGERVIWLITQTESDIHNCLPHAKPPVWASNSNRRSLPGKILIRPILWCWVLQPDSALALFSIFVFHFRLVGLMIEFTRLQVRRLGVDLIGPTFIPEKKRSDFCLLYSSCGNRGKCTLKPRKNHPARMKPAEKNLKPECRRTKTHSFEILNRETSFTAILPNASKWIFL